MYPRLASSQGKRALGLKGQGWAGTITTRLVHQEGPDPTAKQEGLLGKLKGAVLDHLRPDDHTRGTAYRQAEQSAAEALEEQVQDGTTSPGLDEMQLAEGQEGPHSTTGARGWKQENAEPAAEVPLRKEDLQ